MLSNDPDASGTVERNGSVKMGSMEIEERKKRIDDGIFGFFLGLLDRNQTSDRGNQK